MENVGMKTGTGTYDRIFRAIGDPHRIQIMELLREKELSAGEILEAIDVVQSTLSHHMKTLVESGAVNASRRGKWTYYSLNQENLKDAAELLEAFAKGTKVLAEKTSSQNAHLPKTDHSSPVQILKSLESIDEEPEEKATEKAAEKAIEDYLMESVVAALEKSEKKKSKKNKKNKKNKKKE